MLTYVGIALGEEWTKIKQYTHYIDIAVIVGIIIVVIILVKKRIID